MSLGLQNTGDEGFVFDIGLPTRQLLTHSKVQVYEHRQKKIRPSSDNLIPPPLVSIQNSKSTVISIQK